MESTFVVICFSDLFCMNCKNFKILDRLVRAKSADLNQSDQGLHCLPIHLHL